jgi:hypothetical protein
MRHSAAGAMAVVLDVPRWARDPAPVPVDAAQNALWLSANGWRVVTAGPQDPLPAVWQELGTAGRTVQSRPRTSTIVPGAAS